MTDKEFIKKIYKIVGGLDHADVIESIESVWLHYAPYEDFVLQKRYDSKKL